MKKINTIKVYIKDVQTRGSVALNPYARPNYKLHERCLCYNTGCKIILLRFNICIYGSN